MHQLWFTGISGAPHILALTHRNPWRNYRGTLLHHRHLQDTTRFRIPPAIPRIRALLKRMLLKKLVALLLLRKNIKYINRLAQVHWSRTSLGWLTQSSDTRPSLPKNPEHMSSESVRFDRKGLIYIVIGRQAVSMCDIDCRLNATQICNAAGLTNRVRSNYLKILKGQCDITHVSFTAGPTHSWVPFKDGVFLCQVLKLCDRMKPLFLQASLDVPKEEENYLLKYQSTKLKRQSTKVKRQSTKVKPHGTNVKRQGTKLKLPDGYKALQCCGKCLVYIPSTQKVHAVQLLHLSDIPNPRPKLSRFLSEHDEVPREVLKGHPQAQGTYIGFDDARLLCKYFRISADPVDEIVKEILSLDFPGNHVNGSEIAAADPSDKYSPNFPHADPFLVSANLSHLQFLKDAPWKDSIKRREADEGIHKIELPEWLVKKMVQQLEGGKIKTIILSCYNDITEFISFRSFLESSL